MRILFLGTEMGEKSKLIYTECFLCPGACTETISVHSLMQSFPQLLELSTVMISILQRRKP